MESVKSYKGRKCRKGKTDWHGLRVRFDSRSYGWETGLPVRRPSPPSASSALATAINCCDVNGLGTKAYEPSGMLPSSARSDAGQRDIGLADVRITLAFGHFVRAFSAASIPEHSLGARTAANTRSGGLPALAQQSK